MSIKFWRTTGKYGDFSNFSKHPIIVNGISYKTTEHYYQAMKHTDSIVQNKIRYASTPKKCKEIANSIQCRGDWEEIKYNIMKRALLTKISKYEYIKKKLIETGEEEIIENSPYDYIWGCGADNTGKNLLGKCWMEIREQIKNNE